jgi:2-dehydropantoate 2-reductase
MKILVVGAGAVGGYYGALLLRAGHTVTFVARGEHGRKIRADGLTVELPDAAFNVRADVLEDVSQAAGLDIDVAIVAVKATGLSAVAKGVGDALGKEGVAIPLLNGLDSEDELARVIGAHRVVGGIAQIASRIAAPGRIRVDAPARIVLAPIATDRMPQVEKIAAEFSKAGFECDAKEDLKRVLWNKLLWNAPFNAVCALTRLKAGEVLAVPELEALVREAMAELARVAATEGITIGDRAIESMIQSTRDKFKDSVPSMLQDVLAGRETEALALQGAVVRRGVAAGIDTPVHRTLLGLMLGLDRHGRTTG